MPALAKGAEGKPNIVLIMNDDMGFSDLGCYGSEILTPNLDALAAKGVRFTQFYNAARCCPTRASLLTGLYPHQAGVGKMVSNGPAKEPGPYQGYLNDRCVTIAEALKPAGYRTMMSGKWHVGEFRPHWPTDRGFDKYFGLISGGANYFDYTKTKAKGVKRTMAVDGEEWIPPKEGFYLTDAISDRAVEMLGSHGSGDDPFFLYLAYTAPHWPLHAPPEDIARYRGKYRKGWDALRDERYARQIKMGLIDPKNCSLSPRDEKVQAWASLDEKKQDEMDSKMAVYAAQIDRMDQGIGRVLDKIEALGKAENTLVLFLADNGGCAEGDIWGFDNRKNGLPPGGVDSYMSYGRSWANASNMPFRYFKKNAHEGGIATPLIVRWPAVIKKGGQINNAPGHIVDVMATCIDISGAKYPTRFKGKAIQPMEGKSLKPLFVTGKREPHKVLAWEHYGNRAIRIGDWKLSAVDGKKWELYNLATDRSESNNLAEKHPDKVIDLAAKWEEWAVRVEVKPASS